MLPQTNNKSSTSDTVEPPAAPPFWTTNQRLILLLIFVTIIFTCLLLYNVALPTLTFTQDSFGTVNSTTESIHKEAKTDKPSSSPPLPMEELLESEDIRLERVLKAAAMENKTVILSNLNGAWAANGTMVDIFLDSFKFGNGTRELLKHLVIVNLDRKAYTRCKSIHPHCFALMTEGVDYSQEGAYMSKEYLAIVWRKIDILRRVLQKGYNFIFTDGDIIWFRNPIPILYPDGDFQTACEFFVGDASSLNNWPNTGFLYVKSNNRTIALYNYWYESRKRFPNLHDQDAFRMIQHDQYLKDIKVAIRFFDTDHIGGLCNPSKDLNKVCTMHATCCVGLKAKLGALRVLLEDWKHYISFSERKRTHRVYSWSLLQIENCL